MSSTYNVTYLCLPQITQSCLSISRDSPASFICFLLIGKVGCTSAVLVMIASIYYTRDQAGSKAVLGIAIWEVGDYKKYVCIVLLDVVACYAYTATQAKIQLNTWLCLLQKYIIDSLFVCSYITICSTVSTACCCNHGLQYCGTGDTGGDIVCDTSSGVCKVKIMVCPSYYSVCRVSVCCKVAPKPL